MIGMVKSVKRRSSKYLDQISSRSVFHHAGMGFSAVDLYQDVKGSFFMSSFGQARSITFHYRLAGYDAGPNSHSSCIGQPCGGTGPAIPRNG